MTVFQIIGTLAICIYTTTPIALVPIVFVAYLSNKTRKYYLKTQREISRYEKSTNSPAISGFLSTISGLSTIRAYQKQI
jgi:ATP-binding cassette subfamily C (CFTR/MRP) protein 1